MDGLGIAQRAVACHGESSGGGLPSMLVHYNLLDGSLLVNGSPLTRLPHSYESHPTFPRIFGEVKYSIRNSVGRRAN